MWVKSDCNCKSARQKLKDQQTDKNGGRQVLLEIVAVVTVTVVVCVVLGQVSAAAVSICHRRRSIVEQIKHKMQACASAKLFNITLSGIIIIHCAAGTHTERDRNTVTRR